uniref:Sex hormone-binding globulin n=1 Tax=Amphiprion percula TaxID=161767 RepID=A0A3P8SZH4_AMPPE
MTLVWKAMAGGPLLTLSLALVVLWAEVQGNGEGKKISGSSTVYLSQDRDIWRPLIYTTVNISEINSIKSSFQFRTFDPEGTIFYGDTKNGEDWFVLSLKDGIPLMQISKADILISVAGGPKLNDGKWHTLEVSNHGKFVILEVDGSEGVTVGMQSKQTEEDISGELRLALGGILIKKEQMIIQFEPQMDGCVRQGNWLNLSTPWQIEAEDLWPCYQNIRPGSYFSGKGLAVFNTSVFLTEEDDGLKIELWSDFTQMDGTVLSIKAPGQDLMFTLVANNNTKVVTFALGENKINMKSTLRGLLIHFMKDSLTLHADESDLERTDSIMPVNHPGYLTTWREGHLTVGGLLGDGEDNVGSQFLTGCLRKIQVQEKDLDLDFAVKHMSISSHSCPA